MWTQSQVRKWWFTPPPSYLARISVPPNLLIKFTNPVASSCLQSTGGCWFNWQISSVRASSMVCRSSTWACWPRILWNEISANSGASSLNPFIWNRKRRIFLNGSGVKFRNHYDSTSNGRKEPWSRSITTLPVICALQRVLKYDLSSL